jgi:hypothetical protein
MDPARIAESASAWAAAEGWNPAPDDAQRFLAADPGAFLATERDGEIVATVSCALHSDSFAFIGFYIVRDGLRGSGLGHPLFTRALERAGERVVGLDGVLEQQGSYERRGFVVAHRNVRWRVRGGGERPEGLGDLGSIDADELAAYDEAVAGYPRPRFLRAWTSRPEGHALAVTRDRSLAGYGIVRACRDGMKIGPLFADDAQAAETLLRGLLAAAGEGTDVFIDMPAANPHAERLRESRAMEPAFETARMYRGGRIAEDVARTFGVTTLELG